MAEMLLEAAVGAVVGELLEAVLKTTNRAVQFRPTLVRLASTLKSIEPVIEEIQKYDRQLDRRKDETEKLIEEMKNGKKLVLKCSEIQWWRCCFRPHYQKQLEALDESLRRFFAIDMQAHIARDTRETLVLVRKLNMVARNERSLCSAPEPPSFTVGLDVALVELKVKVLQDGASVLVVTGSPGSGKTTLAKMLCWDKDVQGKFKDNIFFVRFSKTPNLNTIVQKLYQHNGHQVPELQNNEDAVNQLERLLKLIGGSSTLFILDDVWHGSESLVENFVLQMPDYKILVTSRFAIRRFSPPHLLKPLGDEDAMNLFRYSADLKKNNFDILDDVVREIVRGCSGSPLALNLIGRLLCGQPPVVWQSRANELSKGHSIFESHEDLLACLQ